MDENASSAPERVDRRGTPPGQGVVVTSTGGRIGNPPFVPTEEQRKFVRHYAKAFPVESEENIAVLLGISSKTLRRHFAADIKFARAQMLATIGAQMINRAIDAEAVDGEGKKLAKGDLDAQKFVLARFGKWTTKVEHTGEGGGPIRTFDLSGLNTEQKRALLPVLDQLLAASGAEDGEFTEVGEDDGSGA